MSRSARGASARRPYPAPLLPLVLALAGTLAAPPAAGAQSMRDALNQLFVFGPGSDPLFLAGSAGVPSTQVHGDHFIPSATAANASVIDFFTEAVARNVSSFPIPTTVASETFVFVKGVPTPTSSSFGPISAERAQTLGRGRLSAGMTYTRLGFQRIRGVDLKNVDLTFVHQNVDFPNCDRIFGGDCSKLGVPAFENDVIGLTLNLNIDAEVLALYTTYGLTDWLDLGVAVPVVGLNMVGSSLATITPFGGDSALHFFGGTPENPVLSDRSQSQDQVTGIGDVAVRLKAEFSRRAPWQAAVLAEVRAPTGREEDLLGSGSWNAKGLLILSGDFSGFSPHANLGYEFRGSSLDQNDFQATLGFDDSLADWVTMAVDLLGVFKVGTQTLRLPQPVTYDAPFRRTISLTNIPERRDDTLDGAFGFKFRAAPGLVVIANALVPLNQGGLRPGVVPTLGIEYSR